MRLNSARQAASTSASAIKLAARRLGGVLRYVLAHAGEGGFADGQFQEEVAFDGEALRERHLGRVADEALDVREPSPGCVLRGDLQFPWRDREPCR
jgi:hypothetical protein